ncbi:Alpha/beta hydrolase fold [Trema orientale]|uniref:Alpha/beta hydrolase fold n=1 Tax=Trema orientale TaxID=63057 RepID=A0A2P5AFS4_TREOI|nr:Alpha/beta hydrolase fold [Trema orientale]
MKPVIAQFDCHVVLLQPPAKKIPPSESDLIAGVRSKDVIFLHTITLRTHVYHNFVSSVVAAVDTIAVSIDYGLFSYWPMPVCYDVKNGLEDWLNNYADLDWAFIGGDSTGGNITHDLVGSGQLEDWASKSKGLSWCTRILVIVISPSEFLEEMVKKFQIGCGKVLVFVAEDSLLEAGKRYVEELRKVGGVGLWRL